MCLISGTHDSLYMRTYIQTLVIMATKKYAYVYCVLCSYGNLGHHIIYTYILSDKHANTVHIMYALPSVCIRVISYKIKGRAKKHRKLVDIRCRTK